MTRILILVTLLSAHAQVFSNTIQAASFFSPSSVYSPAMSPNGNRIAYIKASPDGHTLIVHEIDSQKTRVARSTNASDAENELISSLEWIDDRYLTFTHVEKRIGVRQLLDTKYAKRLLIMDTQPDSHQWHTFSVRTKGRLVSPLPEKPYTFLYAKSGSISRVFELDVRQLAKEDQQLGKLDLVDGGQFTSKNVVRKVKGFTAAWFFDHQQNISAALRYNRDSEMELVSLSSDTEETILKTWRHNDNKIKSKKVKDESDKKLVPVRMATSNSEFYCFDSEESLSRSVYRVDFVSGEEELLYRTSSYEIKRLYLSDEGDLVGVGVLRNGLPIIELVDSAQPLDTSLSDNPVAEGLLGKSLDKQKDIVYSEAHNKPGAYHVRENGKTILRLALHPELPVTLNSKLVHSTVKVDELNVPYLLSIPATTKSHPLIVLPHGGPIGVHDHPYFDQVTQFLVDNDFAVLRVNFRGSSGYSDAYSKAGDKQWYAGMLKDIEYATRDVMKRSDINHQQICTMGFSYGGYAASMLSIRNPELFKCTVSISPVTDLALYLSSSYLNEEQFNWVKEKVGDIEEDYTELRKGSIVDNVELISTPVFLAHGEQDTTVDIEHSYRYKFLLDKYNKDYEWYKDEESGHHFDKAGAMAKLMRKVLPFLEENMN